MPASVRRVPRLTAMLAVAAGLVPLGGAAPAARAALRDSVHPTLYVSYAMNCTFTITDDLGKTVSSIAPGTYQVLVTTPVDFAGEDLSGISDFTACKGSVQFQTTGPGVDISTTLEDGDASSALLIATFRASSTYTAQDNSQPSVARKVISVLASGSPTNPTNPYIPSSSPGKPTVSTDVVGSKTKLKLTEAATSPLRGTLAAAVSAAGKLTLTLKGKPVATLKHGRYTFAVTDKTAKSSFTVQELRKQATTLTGISFVGKRTVTVDLKVGQWMAYSGVGKKYYFIVIA